MTDQASSGGSSVPGFLRVLQLASTVCMGGLATFLASVKEVNPRVIYHFGPVSIIALIVVGGSTFMFFHVLCRHNHWSGVKPADRRVRRFSLTIWLLILVGGMLLSVGRAMRNLPQAHFSDMIEGSGMALVALAALGVVLWRIIRFLEYDHARTLSERGEDTESDGL